jgi:hypothetical protein
MQVSVKNMCCWVETYPTETNISCYILLCREPRHGGCVRTTRYKNYSLMGSNIFVTE